MPTKIFCLGRPGSGKTTAFQIIKMMADDQVWHPILFREYNILYKMLQSDTHHNFIETVYGGFEVRSFSVLQESARLLEINVNTYISNTSEKEFVCIELARGNYEEEMRYFSPAFLADAYFLFTEADVETCIQRIHHRVTHAETSRHFVPDSILRNYYSQDNIAYMQYYFKQDYRIRRDVTAISNNGSLEAFSEEIKAWTILMLENIQIPVQR